MEGDDQLALKAGISVDALVALCPDGKVCTLPSDNRLIEQHLPWAEAQDLFHPLEPVIRQTVKEVTVAHTRPRRERAQASVCSATFAGE
jgi:hypothetical protein